VSPGTAGQWGQGSAPTETDNCGSQKRITRNAADVLVVLDKSASMNDRTKSATGGTSTRYKDVVQALNQVLPQTNETVNWGLELFPGEPGGCTAGSVDVAIKPMNASAVTRAMDPSVVTPGGLTPVTASLANAVKALVTLDDGNPKYIVLGTDGEPNCNTGWGSAADNAAEAVRAAKDAGIPVFVVSLSSEGSPETLNKMALAGGKPIDDPKTKYYKAETTDEMVAVMSAIHKQIATCQFKLPSAPPVPENVLVVYDGDRRVSQSATTWGYVDASKTVIDLHGDDCKKVMDGRISSVEMLYGCPAGCGATQQNETARNMADVLLVLDRSASMNDGTTGAVTSVSGTRYKDVVAALNQVLPQTDAAINWGLELFPGAAGGCTPGEIDLAIKPNNARAVSAVYDPRLVTPTGLTPVTPSLQNATKALLALNDGNPKYIVLATDGEPNCANEPKDAVAAIGAAKDAGIPVFVISLSKEGSVDTLNKMAVAGGKPYNDPSDPKIQYYRAETSAQLITAMNVIRKEIATCQFKLPSAPPVPSNVLVIYDDGHRALPSSTTWGYDNAAHTSIAIYGDDCSKLRDGTYQKVRIVYGCPAEEQLIP
jgi:Mg-chelatase subunit ChlD